MNKIYENRYTKCLLLKKSVFYLYEQLFQFRLRLIINFKKLFAAYVSGETPGLVKERPYHMGDTLNGKPGLDIEVEKKLAEAKLEELKAQGASEDTIKLTMKDMGLERYHNSQPR